MREYWSSLNFDAQCHDSGVSRFIKLKLDQYKGRAFIDFGCRGKPYPKWNQRASYSVGPSGTDNYRKHLGPTAVSEKDGFIFVYQDVRGRFMSEGMFIEMTPHKDMKKSARDVDESTDAYDTIDWLVKNVPGNNGKAGLYGISYPGFFVAASMIDSHPALKACSPQAPVTD